MRDLEDYEKIDEFMKQAQVILGYEVDEEDPPEEEIHKLQTLYDNLSREMKENLDFHEKWKEKYDIPR